MITDDVDEHSVSRLKDMKANHEALFSDPAVAMARVLEDETAKTESRKARSLKRLNEVLAWDRDDHQLEESAKLLNGLVSRLKNLPKNARVLVRIIVERARSCAVCSLRLRRIPSASFRIHIPRSVLMEAMQRSVAGESLGRAASLRFNEARNARRA